MTIYANINQHSKYFNGQSTSKPFKVVLKNTTDIYCWSGNSNQYRTSDLDFYVEQDGEFHLSGLKINSTEDLVRCLDNHLTYLNDLSASKNLDDLEALYQENFSGITKTLQKILSIIPENRPRCATCENFATHCRCDW